MAVARLTLPKFRLEPAAVKRNSSSRLAVWTTSPMVIVLPSLTALTDRSCEAKVEVPATPMPAAEADNLMPVTVFAAPAMVSAETKNCPPWLVALITPPVSTLTSRPRSPMFRPADSVTALVAPATMSMGLAKLASPMTPLTASLAVSVTVPPEEMSAPALSSVVLMLPCADDMVTLAVAPLAVTDWNAMLPRAETDTAAFELAVVTDPKETVLLVDENELLPCEVWAPKALTAPSAALTDRLPVVATRLPDAVTPPVPRLLTLTEVPVKPATLMMDGVNTLGVLLMPSWL